MLPFVTLTLLAVAPISSNHGRLLAPEAKVFREGESVLTENINFAFSGSKISGCDDTWNTSYTKHVLTTDVCTVTFTGAGKQSPTEGPTLNAKSNGSVMYELKDPTKYHLISFSLALKQYSDEKPEFTCEYFSNNVSVGKPSVSYSFPDSPVLSHEFSENNIDSFKVLTSDSSKKRIVVTGLTISYAENVVDEEARKITFENCDNKTINTRRGETIENSPEPIEKLGYTFINWYLDGEFENQAQFPMIIDGDVTLYAKWQKTEYTSAYSVNSLINGEYYRIKGKVLQTYSSTAYIMDGESAMKVYSVSSSGFDAGSLDVGSYVDVCGKYDSDKRQLSDLVYMDVTSDFVEDYSKLTSLDDVTSENEHRYIELNRVHLSTAFVSKSAKIEGSDVVIYYTNTNQLGGQTFAADDYVDVSGFVMMYEATKEIYISEISLIAKYTITFDGNGGNGLVSDTALVGERFTRPTTAPTKDADAVNTYEFTGWYTTKECTELFDFEGTPASKNVTVYAGWKAVAKPLSVTFADTEAKGNLTFSYTKSLIDGKIEGPETIYYSSSFGLAEGAVLSDFGNEDIRFVGNKNGGNNDPKYYTSDHTTRFYTSNTLTISSPIKEISSIKFDAGSSITAVENCTQDSSDSRLFHVTDSSKAFSVKFGATAKIAQYSVWYLEDGLVASYSDFRNVQLQFKYDFEFTGDTTCEETGLFVTDVTDFPFDNEVYDDNEYTMEAMAEAYDGHGYKSVNINKNNTWKLGINLTSEQYDLELTACPYVKVNGQYYFGVKKTWSVRKIVLSYVEKDLFEGESKDIFNAFNENI